MVFPFDNGKLVLLDEVGEISVPPSMTRPLKIAGVEEDFRGFDRPQYLASFQQRGTSWGVQLVNVHLFFRTPGPDDAGRRALEVATLARWGDLRSDSICAGARELIVAGDLNMPKARLVDIGEFDFDQVVIEELWDRGDRKVFNAYFRYYLSSHRVMGGTCGSEACGGELACSVPLCVD